MSYKNITLQDYIRPCPESNWVAQRALGSNQVHYRYATEAYATVCTCALPLSSKSFMGFEELGIFNS